MYEIFFIMAFVWSFPILFYFFGIRWLKKENAKALQQLTEQNSQIHTNLNVWFKNYDLFSRKIKFRINFATRQTLYEFNYCDLIINKNNIVIMGIIPNTLFYKNLKLAPVVMLTEQSILHPKIQQVQILNFIKCKNDIEIEFQDFDYPNTMTLVIKNPTPKLRKDIMIFQENCNFTS